MVTTSTGQPVMAATTMADLPELATVRQIADAANVSRKTIYRLVNDGELPAVKIYSAIRINRDAAMEYFGLKGVKDA